MSKKDDDRILVALRNGLSFRCELGRSSGSGRSFVHYYILHPDGRRHYVTFSNLERLNISAMIRLVAILPYDGKDCEVPHVEGWKLTEAGQAVAARLPQIPADEMFAPPKATSPEKIDPGARATPHG